jgi:cytochrome c1
MGDRGARANRAGRGEMNKRVWGTAAAMVILLALSWASWAQVPESQAGSKKWISEAANDKQRFNRIEKYLRGFDQPMWEVGERYEKLHAALLRGNFELASYHWAKIKLTIENGTMKRPARRANADALFLGRRWDSVDEAFGSGDQGTARRGFEAARAACMKCHEAEGVGYMNDQPMFTKLLPVP